MKDEAAEAPLLSSVFCLPSSFILHPSSFSSIDPAGPQRLAEWVRRSRGWRGGRGRLGRIGLLHLGFGLVVVLRGAARAGIVVLVVPPAEVEHRLFHVGAVDDGHHVPLALR